jgi:hypothetical protein
MARHLGWLLATMISLSVIGTVTLAQEALIPAPALPPLPPGSPSVYRLTLEEAQRLALANNTTFALGRLDVQEKSIATDAARRDYFPKLLGSFYYFHFSDNLGKVATFPTGKLGILPPGTSTIAAVVTNQDSTLAAITLAQPIRAAPACRSRQRRRRGRAARSRVQSPGYGRHG